MHRGRSRALLTALLTVYGLYYLLVPGPFGLIDNVDLAIHETGHLVFGPFGEFLGYFGGTLLQLLFPLVFAVSFFRRGDRHAATVAAWWVAQNCWNISVYVQDARAQALPLVGGGEHDWTYLLGELGPLAHDQTVGQVVRAAGMLIFAYATMRGFTYARSAAPPPSDGAVSTT
ncbi:MAG: hypothetical protein ACREMC_06560 [Gemmatimonadales bacterium]